MMRARRPIGIVTLHMAKVRLLDLDAAPVIHLVCPHQALVWILDDPHHHRKYSGQYTLLVFPFGPLYHFGTTFFNLKLCSRNGKRGPLYHFGTNPSILFQKWKKKTRETYQIYIYIVGMLFSSFFKFHSNCHSGTNCQKLPTDKICPATSKHELHTTTQNSHTICFIENPTHTSGAY